MQAEARKLGYIVSTIDINIFNFSEDEIFDLISRNIDGLLLATYIDSMKPAVRRAVENGIVVISGNREFGRVLKVSYRNSIQAMTERLAELGHRRIAFISGYSIKESSHEKYKDFCRALKKQGLELIPELIVDGEAPYIADLDTGYQAMNRLLDRKVRFSAVFAVNDLVAIGAMKALREKKLRVPEDISVVGCDNIAFASYMNPGLATISVPKAEMGKIAADMLAAVLNGKACEDRMLESAFLDGETIGRIRKKQ